MCFAVLFLYHSSRNRLFGKHSAVLNHRAWPLILAALLNWKSAKILTPTPWFALCTLLQTYDSQLNNAGLHRNRFGRYAQVHKWSFITGCQLLLVEPADRQLFRFQQQGPFDRQNSVLAYQRLLFMAKAPGKGAFHLAGKSR